MGTLESFPSVPLVRLDGFYRPLIVVGVTHPQTCLVLRGRLRALRDAGLRVVLVSGPGELADQIAAEEGVEHIAIPMERGLSPLADVVSLFRLCAALHRLQPDLAEFSTPKAGLLGNIASFLCRVPVRIYVLRGLRLETAASNLRRVLHFSERLAVACCHQVVCNSRSLLEKAFALGIAPRHKLRLVGDGSSAGVDIRHFAPRGAWDSCHMRSQLGIAPRAPVVGFVGRLTRDKGVPELMRAFDRLLWKIPNARLLLVGWFDDSEDALNECERSQIVNHPGVICTGFVSDTAPYFHAMDVLVLPTWREGFPNAILEAAASGVPVVSTRVTGARDAVLHNRTGLLVAPGNPPALAEAIEALIHSPELRRRMGQAARSWVEERFFSQRVQSLTVTLYRNLMAEAMVESAAALPTDVAAAAD